MCSIEILEYSTSNKEFLMTGTTRHVNLRASGHDRMTLGIPCIIAPGDSELFPSALSITFNSQSLSHTNNYSFPPSCLTLTLRLPRPPSKPPTSN